MVRIMDMNRFQRITTNTELVNALFYVLVWTMCLVTSVIAFRINDIAGFITILVIAYLSNDKKN
jgi:hypothetical protein